MKQSEEFRKLIADNKMLRELEKTIGQQKGELDKIEEKAVKQDTEFRKLIADQQKLFEKLTAINQKQEAQEEEIKNIKAQNEAQNKEIKEITEKTQDQERKNTPMAADMKATTTTVCVWKISNLQRRHHPLHLSEPFYIYSDQRGYRLRLELPWFNITDPKSSMSFSIRALRGEYDGELVWPFRKAMSITLINQEDGGHEWDIKRKALVCLGKPQLEANISAGGIREFDCMSFQSVASSEQLKQRKYIVDNTVIVRVDVVNK